MNPAVIAALANSLPLLLGLFGGQKERDPRAVFQQLNALLGAQFQPILASAMQLAGAEGARVGQGIAGSIGASGGGSTGVGAAARSVGAGLASARAADARLNATQAQLGLLTQLFPMFLQPGQAQPGAFQNFNTALGMSLVGGVNPFADLAKVLFSGGQQQTTNALVTQAGAPGSAPYFNLPKRTLESV